MNVNSIKSMFFRDNELEIGFKGSIFFGNEQQKVYIDWYTDKQQKLIFLTMYL